MEALRDEEKSESMMSDLDDMWYKRDKESNIQDFEDEDWDDNKETPSLVEIDSPSTPLDEPNITLVEKL
jgi:hypothetical protein